MPEQQDFPLRVQQVFSVAVGEWRPGESLPEQTGEHWQLVYVIAGAVEETADAHRFPLRRGWMFFHQPGEAFRMRAVGELPPQVLRVDFACAGAGMDLFRGQPLRADPAERASIAHLQTAARELFAPPPAPGARAPLRADPPFGAQQQTAVLLELVLLAAARRLRAERQPTARARRDKAQTLLAETVKLYFAQNLGRELDIARVCRDNGCTRARLQKAFRARAHTGAMEYFAALKMERAKELLAAGSAPGETAAQLGFRSGAYFSLRFKRATGTTPREYQQQCFHNERIR